MDKTVFRKIDTNSNELPSETHLGQLQDEFINNVLNLFLEDHDLTSKCNSKSNCVDCNGASEEDCINERILKALEDFIGKYQRIPYNVVTTKIFELNTVNCDDRDIVKLTNRAEALVNYLNKKVEEDKENCNKNKEIKAYSVQYVNSLQSYKIALKLYDHIQLAISQSSSIMNRSIALEEMQQILEDKLSKKVIDSMDKSNELERKVNEANHKYDKITEQLISLVAIFTAVAFIIFGGLTSINTLFEAAKNGIALLNTLALASLFGLIMINATYMFMRFVLVMLGKSNNSIKMMKTTLFSNLILLVIMAACVIFALHPNFIVDIKNFTLESKMIIILIVALFIAIIIINYLLNKVNSQKGDK